MLLHCFGQFSVFVCIRLGEHKHIIMVCFVVLLTFDGGVYDLPKLMHEDTGERQDSAGLCRNRHP